jgi:hypothetical protein
MPRSCLPLSAFLAVSVLALLSVIAPGSAQGAETGLERSVIELWNTCTVPRPVSYTHLTLPTTPYV